MNKKLVLAGVLGLVAIGAGALALSGLGGGSDDAPARQAHAEARETNLEPADGGDKAGGESTELSLGDGNVAKLADPVSPAPSSHDASPSTSNGTTDAAPSESDDASDTPADDDSAEGGDDNTQGGAQETPGTPNIPDGGGMPASDDDGDSGSPIIYNEAVVDAICELLGCNDPVITPDPDFAHDLCELMNCDDGSVTVTPNIKPCQITGNCPPPPVIFKELGIGKYRYEIAPRD